MTAVVALTAGFQPWIVPSSVAKMKTAGLPAARRKSVVLPLYRTAVGDPGAGWLGALGILTPFPGAPPAALSATIVTGTSTGAGVCPAGFSGFKPDVLYSVEVPQALFEIHQGVVGPWTNPQAF